MTIALSREQLEELAGLVADQVAARVLEGLGDQRPAPRLLDAAELAGVLGWTAATVRARAVELGAVRLGNGPRARLRFDVATALERLSVRTASEESPTAKQPVNTGSQRQRRRRRSDSGVRLLSARGSAVGREGS